MSFKNDEMTHKLRVKYENECMFTVFCDDKEIAWCQWSLVWEMWRVMVLSDKRIHHLQDIKSIFLLCSDEIGVDMMETHL